jgi:hypothetical protein
MTGSFGRGNIYYHLSMKLAIRFASTLTVSSYKNFPNGPVHNLSGTFLARFRIFFSFFLEIIRLRKRLAFI